MSTSRITTGSAPGLGLRLCKATAVALCAFGVAAMPAVAQAASNPTSAQYRDVAVQVNEDVGGGGPSASGSGLQHEFVSGLPFTGLDLISLAVVAAVLISVGLALRWLTTARHRHP